MTQNLNLGSIESKLLLTLEQKELSVFTVDDAKTILGTGDSSVWHILNNLVHKNRIKRIQRSKYLLIPARAGIEGHWSEYPWIIVPHLIDAYYVGFWTAMNYWGMTEQIPYTVFVATTKRKRNLEFGNQKFEFVTLSGKKFFGFVREKTGKTGFFNISSKEKTIVDGLTHPEYCGGIPEVAKAMWNVRDDVNWNIIFEMSKQIGLGVVLRRLGYLLDLLEIKQNVTPKLQEESFNGYNFLDPNASRKRTDYSKEYGLIINRTRNQLLGWIDY